MNEFEAGYAFEPIHVAAVAVVARAALAMEVAANTESPIETLFGVAVLSRAGVHGIEFAPQYVWRRYRIDWAFLRDGKPLVFVECDGKAWHSTDEQIARDRRKDAEAAAAGIAVYRFTGSELYRQADACAALVLKALEP